VNRTKPGTGSRDRAGLSAPSNSSWSMRWQSCKYSTCRRFGMRTALDIASLQAGPPAARNHRASARSSWALVMVERPLMFRFLASA
jgi:hypothetical protein